MTLKKQVDGEIKKAMLNKQKERLRALRAIKSAILVEETQKGAGDVLSEDAEMKIVQKAVKQRKDSVDLYKKQGRDDLAQKEIEELQVIEGFLPKQLSESEIENELKTIIKELGVSSPSDMGRIMGNATKKLAGKAEGKLISAIAKRLLTN